MSGGQNDDLAVDSQGPRQCEHCTDPDCCGCPLCCCQHPQHHGEDEQRLGPCPRCHNPQGVPA